MKLLLKSMMLSAMLMMLYGCAQPGNYQEMALSMHDVQTLRAQSPKNPNLKHNLAIESVQGGKKTNPLWTSQVDAESFQQALTYSLTSASLYSKDASKARYHLQAKLLKLEQPMIGIDFKVTSYVQYKLLDKVTNKVIFEKTLVTPFVAKFTDALYGVERLKVANEGAIKENIKALTSSLYEI